MGTDTQVWAEQAPKDSDALKKGILVSIVTLGGRELEGMVCDREQTGLLLEVSGPEDDRAGHVFLPWSSVEQVNIGTITRRRVKVLPS